MLTSSLNEALDAVIPVRCLGCYRRLDGKFRHYGVTSRWCVDCHESFSSPGRPFGHPQIDFPLTAVTYFSHGVRQVINHIKENNDDHLCGIVAQTAAASLHADAALQHAGPCLIVPAPSRRRGKAVNLARTLAKELASMESSWRFAPMYSLHRSAKDSTTLSPEQRLRNVRLNLLCHSSPEWITRNLSGCTAIIIDDVVTSGTTISQTAAALRASGIRPVQAYVLARH